MTLRSSYLWIKLPVAFLGSALVLAGAFFSLMWWGLDSETLMTYKRDMVAWKMALLEKPHRKPAVILIGGSSTLYSYETPLLEQLAGRPAVNFGTQWGISFFAAERAAEMVVPGDIVVMPLEYNLYDTTAAGEVSYVESCYLLSQARETLKDNLQRLEALWGCNKKLAIYGLFIKFLRMAGQADPVNDMGLYLNAHGDIMENAAGKHLVKLTAPTAKMFENANPVSFVRLDKLIQSVKDRGGVFVLTFPPYPLMQDGTTPISQQWYERLQRWADNKSIYLASTPQAHGFPVECFYDSSYHLHRGCTEKNTRVLYDSIKGLW